MHGTHGVLPAPQNLGLGSEDDGVRALRDDGGLDAAADPKLGADMVVALYRVMVHARLLDERLGLLQRQGRVSLHVGSQGEEAAILGSAAALRDKDWIFPSGREFGAALWRGMPLASYVNHMFGNALDPMKGRQTPDHYGSRVARFAPIRSPVGTQISQATGFAWAARTKKDDTAALVYFGEGATSSSEFHAGANFAGVFRAPVVFFCFCRNRGGGGSAPAAPTASATLAAKGVAYGIPSVRCDGNDLFAVFKVTRDAILRASRGEGATFIEARTLRMPPAGPDRAAPASVIAEAWKKKDPLGRVRRHLELRGLWSEANQKDHEASAHADIDAALAAAEALPPPAVGTLFDDVYATLPRALDEERALLLASPRAQGLAKA
jgi:2-oxoisovalerate dehydrogenase E1 component alpha subunit